MDDEVASKEPEKKSKSDNVVDGDADSEGPRGETAAEYVNFVAVNFLSLKSLSGAKIKFM